VKGRGLRGGVCLFVDAFTIRRVVFWSGDGIDAVHDDRVKPDFE